MPDPDYRFLLANERTFLALVRTALALEAGEPRGGHRGTRADVVASPGRGGRAAAHGHGGRRHRARPVAIRRLGHPRRPPTATVSAAAVACRGHRRRRTRRSSARVPRP